MQYKERLTERKRQTDRETEIETMKEREIHTEGVIAIGKRQKRDWAWVCQCHKVKKKKRLKGKYSGFKAWYLYHMVTQKQVRT